MTSPLASPRSFKDAQTIAKMARRCKVLTHVRCDLEDAKLAIDTGVDGMDMLFGTSSLLRTFSHGKDIEQIIRTALVVIDYIKSQGVQVRFSSEDSFRSELGDILRVYAAVDKLHPERVGLADTVGVATPLQVYDMVAHGARRGQVRHRVPRPQRCRLRHRQLLHGPGGRRHAH